MSLIVGSQAPDFILPGDDGREFKLSDHLEGYNLLYFYPKDNTSGCTKEAEDFKALFPEFQRLNTRIIGISKDSIASHQKFKAKYELPFLLLSDESHEMLESYGVWVEKSMYGRKYMGIERSSFLIDPSGEIAAVWRKVKVPGHAEAVLKTIKELTA